jgi:hypothetical protein
LKTSTNEEAVHARRRQSVTRRSDKLADRCDVCGHTVGPAQQIRMAPRFVLPSIRAKRWQASHHTIFGRYPDFDSGNFRSVLR